MKYCGKDEITSSHEARSPSLTNISIKHRSLFSPCCFVLVIFRIIGRYRSNATGLNNFVKDSDLGARNKVFFSGRHRSNWRWRGMRSKVAYVHTFHWSSKKRHRTLFCRLPISILKRLSIVTGINLATLRKSVFYMLAAVKEARRVCRWKKHLNYASLENGQPFRSYYKVVNNLFPENTSLTIIIL